MLTHILIPLDGSALAREAVDVATRIVDSTCEITLVTAVQVPEYPVFDDTPMLNTEYGPTLESVRHDGKQYLEGIADALRQSGYRVNTRVEVGDPAECIIHIARELGVDLIVMSTHGRSGVKRWLFGSVANRVLNNSAEPVLVVPNRVIQEKNRRENATLNLS